MIVNENLLKYMFNKKSVIKHFLLFTAMIASMTLIILFITIKLYTQIYSNYKFTLNNVYVPESYNIGDIMLSRCKAVSCKEVLLVDGEDSVYRYKLTKNTRTADKIVYISNQNVNYHWLTEYLNNDLNLVVGIDNQIYIINDGNFIENIINITLYLYFMLFIFYSIIASYMQYLAYKNQVYEKGSYKMYTETKIQGNITEMLHHEINAPIAVLRSAKDEIYSLFNEYKVNEKETEEIRRAMEYGITRLETILSMLYQSRDIKKDDTDDNSIYMVLNHIVSSVNKINIGKLEPEFIDGVVLDELRINKTLGNGNFLNILQVMLNNSLEAGANKIVFKPEVINSNFIWLYIKDNGRGIRDKNDRIFSNSGKVLTSYGYSSKDKNGKQLKGNMVTRLLGMLGIQVIKTDTNRGIGLYMNKTILRSVGGDIELFETSKEGTTFKIKIPVKKVVIPPFDNGINVVY